MRYNNIFKENDIMAAENLSIAIVHHQDCLLHQGSKGHPEQPDRVKVIQAALQRYPFDVNVKFYQAPLASREQLLTIHDADYVNWIFSIAPQTGSIEVDADTWMNTHTLKAALHAAGSVTYAVDLIMQKKAQAAFCNVRPPGHHAERDKAMGFCFFNNVALGVKHAMQEYQLERIAIIDFDVHHGNGTQNIFQQDKKLMYCSSFQSPFFPGYDPEMDNEHILSVPLLAGTDSATFRAKVEAAWFDKLAAFQPQFIFFSAGFDAHRQDPLANIDLTEADYVWLTNEIAKIAKVYADGRIVSVLEGGYNLDVLAQCVPAHVNALLIK
jgi:acetoin utilization deacetylase AcuC-like enzyme